MLRGQLAEAIEYCFVISRRGAQPSPRRTRCCRTLPSSTRRQEKAAKTPANESAGVGSAIPPGVTANRLRQPAR